MVDVLFTDEFEGWWDGLSAEEQESISHDVNILREQGVALRFPRSSGVSSSRHRSMRELRISTPGGGRTACCTHSTPVAQPFC
jgi:hypothetical protein